VGWRVWFGSPALAVPSRLHPKDPRLTAGGPKLAASRLFAFSRGKRFWPQKNAKNTKNGRWLRQNRHLPHSPLTAAAAWVPSMAESSVSAERQN